MEVIGFILLVLALTGALCLPAIRRRAEKDSESDCRIVYGVSGAPFTETDKINAAKALAEMEKRRIAVHKALRKTRKMLV